MAGEWEGGDIKTEREGENKYIGKRRREIEEEGGVEMFTKWMNPLVTDPSFPRLWMCIGL